MPESPVRELRLALTVDRYPEAVAFYRDVLGLPVLAGRLVAGGAEALADPVVTPWRHRNVRLRAPDGTQLTLFSVLGDAGW